VKRQADVSTGTTTETTDAVERFAAHDLDTTAQGDPDMFAVNTLTDPPGGSEPHDASPDVPQGGGIGLAARHFSEVLPSEELPPESQPGPEQQGHEAGDTGDRLGQPLSDAVLELTNANENLRRQLADSQREIDGLRRMLQVSADVIQGIPAGLFLFQYQHPGELFFLNCNPEATRLTGLGQEDCRGVELDEIWPNARSQGLTDAFLDAARSGTPFDASKALYRNSKIERILRVKAFAIPGERLGVAFLELPSPNQTEEALRRAQEEKDRRIEERNSQPACRTDRLEAECAHVRQSQDMALKACRLAAQEQVACRAARVLASPIENVQEAATRALARLDSGYISLIRPSLEQIQQEANRLCCLVKHLKQCAGIAPTGDLPPYKALDLNQIVSDSVETLSNNAGTTDSKDVTRLVQELILGQDCHVNCDPAEIRDVVDTLLQHALDATDRRGGVTVTTLSDEACVILEVRDPSGGMPEEDLSRLFEPFCTWKPGYAGLGLAGVSGVVRRYGGDIGVVTGAGKGITITVRLPRAEVR
jgi:two-component system, sensor histidine kinase